MEGYHWKSATRTSRSLRSARSASWRPTLSVAVAVTAILGAAPARAGHVEVQNGVAVFTDLDDAPNNLIILNLGGYLFVDSNPLSVGSGCTPVPNLPSVASCLGFTSLDIATAGPEGAIARSPELRAGAYLWQGRVVRPSLAEAFQLPCEPLPGTERR